MVRQGGDGGYFGLQNLDKLECHPFSRHLDDTTGAVFSSFGLCWLPQAFIVLGGISSLHETPDPVRGIEKATRTYTKKVLSGKRVILVEQ